ncbi:MAG: FHA domain-containing protein [Gammaproteobacteria bacterium]
MGIIDELKKQALQHKKQHGSDADDVINFTHANLVEQLQKVHQFLRQLVDTLHDTTPDLRVDLPIKDLAVCTNLKQENFRLLAESQARSEVISLSCNLINEQPCALPVPEIQKLETLAEQLAALDVRAEIITSADKAPFLEVSGVIPARLVFEVDTAAALIRAKIHNYAELGHQHFYLRPEQVNDDFLEALGEFILRRNARLLSILQESTSGVLTHSLPDPDPKTEQMETSRLKSIFNQDNKLFLTYHNTIKELGSKAKAFILGRSRDCDILVDSDLASRQHAQIVFRKGKFVLSDMSTNGTFVKTQGGKEVYLQKEELPLTGSGFISLGKSVSVDNEHLIYFSCQ